MATLTRVYPLARTPNGQPIRGVLGIPHVVTEAPTKAEAEALVATGAFTLDAKDPDRVQDEPAATSEPTPTTEPAPAGEE